MPVGHMGWSPDYGGKIGGIRPGSPPPLVPKQTVDEILWKKYYSILFGGASVALVALRGGDSASALAALEKAFEALPGSDPGKKKDTEETRSLDPGPERF